MSLATQLNKGTISNSIIFNSKSEKKKKTLTRGDGSSIGRAQHYQKAREAFIKLCEIDKRFQIFEDLFSEKTIDLVPTMVSEKQFLENKFLVAKFFYTATQHLLVRCCMEAIDWLIYKFEAHVHQPHDILISCLPAHEHEIFPNYVRLLDMTNESFSWLKCVYDSGQPISSEHIKEQCMKSPALIRMICNWPNIIYECIKDDQRVGQELMHVITKIGVKVADAVRLIMDCKKDDYLSPFVDFINDGLRSDRIEYYSAASVLLLQFSEKLALNRRFVKHSVKKLLTNGVISVSLRLKTIVQVENNLGMLRENRSAKVKKLFDEQLVMLNDNEREWIEMMNERNCGLDVNNEGSISEMDVYDDGNNNVVAAVLANSSTSKSSIKAIVQSIHLSKSISVADQQLVDIIRKYLLHWRDNNNSNKDKLALAIARHIRRDASISNIKYRPGGVVSHLCAAMFHPYNKVRKHVQSMIHGCAKDWPRYSRFTGTPKEIRDNPNDANSEYNWLMLEEMEELLGAKNEDETVIGWLCLHLINDGRLLDKVVCLKNAWDLLMKWLKPVARSVDKEYRQTMIYLAREALVNGGFDHNIPDDKQINVIDALLTDGNRRNDAVGVLNKLPLSINNWRYLFCEKDCNVDVQNKKDCSVDISTKSISKFTNSINDVSIPLVNNIGYLRRISLALEGLSLNKCLSVDGHIELIPDLMTILKKIVQVANFSQNPGKLQDISNESVDDTHTEDLQLSNGKLIDLCLLLMSCINNALTSIIDKQPTFDRPTLSIRVHLQDVTKCLLLFDNPSLTAASIAVFQKCVRLQLGLELFNLITFINTVGRTLVPRSDARSSAALSSIINETLPILIQRQPLAGNISSRVCLLSNFVRHSTGINKQSVGVFYKDLVSALSNENDGSCLWILLVFLVSWKGRYDIDCILSAVMSQFPADTEFECVLYTLAFVRYSLSTLNENKKRSREAFNSSGSLDSPSVKRRKVSNGNEYVYGNKADCTVSFAEFEDVKKKLGDCDFVLLVRSLVDYFLVAVARRRTDMAIVRSTLLVDTIGLAFDAIRMVSSCAAVPVVQANVIIASIRCLINSIGNYLPSDVFLGIVITLLQRTAAANKVMDFLGSALQSMAEKGDKPNYDHCSDISDLIRGVLIEQQNEQINSPTASLTCLVHLLQMGVVTEGSPLASTCKAVVNCILSSSGNPSSNNAYRDDVLIDIFLRQFLSVATKDFQFPILRHAVTAISSASPSERVESSLSLVHALLISHCSPSAFDISDITRLFLSLCSLTSTDAERHYLSSPSIQYQKAIRMCLSKFLDTTSVVHLSADAVRNGIESCNASFLSGGLSLFGCHLRQLHRAGTVWSVNDINNDDGLWQFVLLSMDLRDHLIGTSHLVAVETVLSKTMTYLVAAYGHSSIVLDRLFRWLQVTDPSNVRRYLRRSATYATVVDGIITNSSDVSKAVKCVNEADFLRQSVALLRLVNPSAKFGKSKRASNCQDASVTLSVDSSLLIPINDHQHDMFFLMKAVCSALQSLLIAEHKQTMTLAVTDDVIDLICVVCSIVTSTSTSIDGDEEFFDKTVIPLVCQIAVNSANDETLIRPLATTLCRQCSGLSTRSHTRILKTLQRLKEALGSGFDICLRDNVVTFVEESKLCDDPIGQMAEDLF